MPLLVDDLSVWDISFRWAGYDPDCLWLRLPLPVKDNFRLLMGAILGGEIMCETLTLAKRPRESKADAQFYIRTYIDEVYHCIQGLHYDRKLLRWARISRMDFLEWSEIRGIPAPEFWFPPGWKVEFEMPEFGTSAIRATHVEPEGEGEVHIRYDRPGYTIRDEEIDEEKDGDEDICVQSNDEKPSQSAADNAETQADVINEEPPVPPVEQTEIEQSLRYNQRIKIVCQQIASAIWNEDKTRTIASVVRDELIQKYGGAAPYEDDTVREWVKQVAPPEVRSRRGRPRKNGGKDRQG